MIGPQEQLARIVPVLDELVEGIALDGLYDATPCDTFTVHDVLDHMIGVGGQYAAMFRGQAVSESTAPPVYGRVPELEFRSAMADLLDAVSSDGALDRVLGTPMGDLPGETMARFVAFDGLVHGWDIATATGQDYEVDPDVVSACSAFIREALTDDMRDGDTFKDAVTPPDGSSPLEELIAFSGRSI